MMISILGFSHHRCSISFREKVAIDIKQYKNMIHTIQALTMCEDIMFFNTCNRTEIIMGSEHQVDIKSVLIELSQHCDINYEQLLKHHYCFTNQKAISHLLRVACGLDSRLVGEAQVFGQLKNAYKAAKDVHAIQGPLDWIMQEIFTATKTIRHQTQIDHCSESIGYAIKKLCQHHEISLNQSNILFVGTGEMISLALQYIFKEKPLSITVASRSLDRAQDFARPYLGKGIKVQDLPKAIKSADIVITASQSQLPIIGKGMIETLLAEKKHLTLFDLAIPRDIEPEISNLDHVTLYHLDQIQGFIEKEGQQRDDRIQKAEQLVSTLSSEILKTINLKNQQQLIIQLRERSFQITSEQIKKAKMLLTKGTCPEAVIVDSLQQLTSRLLHLPTTQLKNAIYQKDQEKTMHLKQLFDLESQK